ncbi:MAG: hypothetical protein ABIR33_09390 [Pyrinomonadaceae bacterium]
MQNTSLWSNPAWVGAIGTLAGGIIVGIFGLLAKRIDRSVEDTVLFRMQLERAAGARVD